MSTHIASGAGASAVGLEGGGGARRLMGGGGVWRMSGGAGCSRTGWVMGAWVEGRAAEAGKKGLRG